MAGRTLAFLALLGAASPARAGDGERRFSDRYVGWGVHRAATTAELDRRPTNLLLRSYLLDRPKGARRLVVGFDADFTGGIGSFAGGQTRFLIGAEALKKVDEVRLALATGFGFGGFTTMGEANWSTALLVPLLHANVGVFPAKRLGLSLRGGLNSPAYSVIRDSRRFVGSPEDFGEREVSGLFPGDSGWGYEVTFGFLVGTQAPTTAHPPRGVRVEVTSRRALFATSTLVSLGYGS